MEISAKELKIKFGKIIEQAAQGTEVIITVRGKKMAKLIPYKSDKFKNTHEDKIFGMWEDNVDLENVDDHVRALRKGRKF